MCVCHMNKRLLTYLLNDEETVNLARATIIFSSCAFLFGLKRKGVILCGFN